MNTQPIEIVMNAAAGTGGNGVDHGQLSKLFSDRGIKTEKIEARSGEELVSLARSAAASNADMVIAAGGDGTISAVAAAIAGTGKTLGVLPLGTLNHFAKDLNIPPDLEGAIDVIAAGHSIMVDVAEVNGRVFINNSSLGLYPDMVRGRELRQRLGYGKWHALARSVLTVFRRYPMLGVRLKVDGKEIVTRTPFIFIGNNEYKIETFNIGARERIDGGHLSVYMTRRSGRMAMMRIALKAIFGGLSQEKDFLTVMTDEVRIETRRPNVRVALDGEVIMIKMPLQYSIRPGVLKVIVSEDRKNEENL